MPYSTDNPPSQTKNMPEHAKKIFISAFNSALKKYGNEETAFKVAFAAVKTKYTQTKDGKWVKKEEKALLDNYHLLPMYITKAVMGDNGEMIWHSTASDTGLDLYEESMSVQLYKGFIDSFTKESHIFVSLSHYPSLSGKAELGKATSLYIDGEKFKAKGIFYDTLLGKAAYNAIRKDRRDNPDLDTRIRVSIGFYDHHHRHGKLGEWSIKSDVPCLLCAQGVKEKVYLRGILNHVALTRSPARITTDISVVERN